MREGVQICKRQVPTEVKLKILQKLSEIAFDKVEATSVVRPDLVPQHSDFREVLEYVSGLENRHRFTALYLNVKGFKILTSYDLGLEPWIHTALSEKFLLQNVSRDLTRERLYFEEIQQALQQFGFQSVNLMVSCAFGHSHRFTITEFANNLEAKLASIKMPISEICLADTVGLALPSQVKRFVKHTQTFVKNVSLHLHDTLGLGLLNVKAGLETGVTVFESSLGGVGGCPFLEGASGNVATEEIVLALSDEGVETGINIQELRELLELYKTIFQGYIHSKAALAFDLALKD